MKSVILLNLIVTLFMTGVIWTIQLVHYPSFRFVDHQQFIAFSHFHQKMISYVVMPAMIVEILASLYLVKLWGGSFISLVLLLLVIGVWLSTFLLSVPIHTQLLSEGSSADVINKLVVTNWPRTFLWSLRAALLAYVAVIYV